MKKSEIIKSLIGSEFYFVDFGVVGLREDGVVVHWGKPCEVEVKDGKWSIANLYKLPTKWAEACLHSSLFDEWIDPDDKETQRAMTRALLEEEFGC